MWRPKNDSSTRPVLVVEVKQDIAACKSFKSVDDSGSDGTMHYRAMVGKVKNEGSVADEMMKRGSARFSRFIITSSGPIPAGLDGLICTVTRIG